MTIMYTDSLSRQIKSTNKRALTFNTSFVYMMINNIFTYFGCMFEGKHELLNTRNLVLICKIFVHKKCCSKNILYYEELCINNHLLEPIYKWSQGLNNLEFNFVTDILHIKICNSGIL